ncbi:MAG TPA: ABC transporter substrate-binding protein [Actinomycetota bacterium]|nr:ABC transporter substrate-binding protein [Actinomycetota bacterium]
MQLRRVIRLVAVLGAVGMIASACGGGKKAGPTPGATATAGKKGGSAVFGAEQWPQCLNIITSCNTSTWMQIVGPQPTLPRTVILDAKGNYAKSDLVTELPSLENGGITADPFSVTYKLDPKAVWDDGTPITSKDIEFTWKAILYTTGTTATVGYDLITSIDTSDAHTAKLLFKQPFADWADLFGGGTTNGYVLKKAAFPNADEAKPDLKDEMNNIIPFSGGPWKMTSWSKSQEILVRNPKFWGHQPLLDQVTFVPLEEQPQEIAALLSGQVDVINPQAGASSVIDSLKANSNAKSVSGPTNYGDGFWFNNRDPVLKDFKVRQAIAYGVDREKIVDQVIKLNDPNATVLNCLPPLFPVIDAWCSDVIQAEMAKYNYDPQKSLEILKSDGYDCSKAPKSPCTKDGKPLKIIAYYTAGNTRRQAVGAIAQESLKAAGIQWVPKPNDATDLFSNKLQKGDFQVIEFASGTIVDPSPAVYSYLCRQIPTAANKYSGANQIRYCNKQLDPLMEQSDKELDPAKRHQLIDQVYTQFHRDIPALPLYPFINITAWRTDKIAGPIGEWNQAPYATYWNMDFWYKV